MTPSKSVILHLILIGCLFLSACAATGARFAGPQTPESGKSDVYVYRISKFQAALKPYEVILDGNKVGSLVNGSYMKFTVTPGSHEIILVPAFGESSGQRAGIQLQTTPNSTAYLRMNFGMSSAGTLFKGSGSTTSLWNSHNSLTEVAPAEAVTELADLNAVQ